MLYAANPCQRYGSDEQAGTGPHEVLWKFLHKVQSTKYAAKGLFRQACTRRHQPMAGDCLTHDVFIVFTGAECGVVRKPSTGKSLSWSDTYLQVLLVVTKDSNEMILGRILGYSG